MATWTYSDIKTKVRGLTSRPDTGMLSDATLGDYINKFYQYVLPKEIKVFFGYTYNTFTTLPNIDQYTPSALFQTFNPQVYIDGFPADWYLAPDLFYQDYPQQANKLVVATGNGVTNSFTFTVAAFPIIRGSLYVTDGTQTAQDDGLGGFTGNTLGGTVNYVTGTVTGLAFTVAPAANTNITATSQTYLASRPQGILYYDNVFTLRPIPDDVYLVKMEGIKIPTALVNPTDVPFRIDLGPLIAYGTAMSIFEDNNQFAEIAQMQERYEKYKDVAMQDTYEEYLYERSIPSF